MQSGYSHFFLRNVCRLTSKWRDTLWGAGDEPELLPGPVGRRAVRGVRVAGRQPGDRGRGRVVGRVRPGRGVGDDDPGERVRGRGAGERRQPGPVDLGRRAVRGLPVGGVEPRRRGRERGVGRVRPGRVGGDDDPGERVERGGRGGGRAQLHPVALGRRPVRGVRVIRQQPDGRGGHEQRLGRVRVRPGDRDDPAGERGGRRGCRGRT